MAMMAAAQVTTAQARAAGYGTVRGPWMPVADLAAQEAKRRRDEFLSGLTKPLQEQIEALESLDQEVSHLEAQFRKERRDLERKYEARFAPLFGRRAAIVSGESYVAGGRPPGRSMLSGLQLSLGGSSASSQVQEEKSSFASGADADAAGCKGVPDFWLGAMRASPEIARTVARRDEAALRSLRDVTCTTLPEAEGIGFRLELHFGPNAFFTNKVLSKTYYLDGSDVDPVLARIIATEIDWKPGKNLTLCRRRKGPQSGGSGRGGSSPSAAEPPQEACASFFHFFITPDMNEKLNEEEFRSAVEAIEDDWRMGMAWKEKVVPHAVRCYTGEADDEYDEACEDGFDGEEYDDYADEDDEDDGQTDSAEQAACDREVQKAQHRDMEHCCG
eukprot:gnl/TRDRNA2_/TRDRNA2_37989_c0_seq1.p1 gnl/TRDRNA2_/TRDRNA2_37989_c0~~gnl/TRDRNA2_/TRDRNA2_37989_c0_seq1.p1  ORF type:complete len:388 (+),score=96.26 gnl/TRDRNA2_/TRDRNA2_37989_c0_seq1:173-1336(+)